MKYYILKIDESNLKGNIEDYLEIKYKQKLDFFLFFKFIESLGRSLSSKGEIRVKYFFYIFHQEFPKYVKIQMDENLDKFLLFLNDISKILPSKTFLESFDYNYDFCIKFQNHDFSCDLNFEAYFLIKENLEALEELTNDEIQLDIIDKIKYQLNNLNKKN